MDTSAPATLPARHLEILRRVAAETPLPKAHLADASGIDTDWREGLIALDSYDLAGDWSSAHHFHRGVCGDDCAVVLRPRVAVGIGDLIRRGVPLS